MWISKAKYLELCQRILELEKNQVVTFGVPMYAIGNEEFRPGADMDTVSGKPVRINELVCAIANHLGFKYKQPGKGGITPPPAVVAPDPLAQSSKRGDLNRLKSK
jgi:hypothetical protein